MGQKALLVLAVTSLVALSVPQPLSSANLTAVKDTLETSRFSFHGKNAANLTTGTTIIQMATTGTPSKSTANLFPGDALVYTASTNAYTVDTIIDDDEFSITSALLAADDDINDEFVVKRTATHTINATTNSAIANGAIRVRIKADGTTPNDGNPDDEGFDFNSITGTDITCPNDVTNYYDFVTGTATASGGTYCTAGYHCFECRYSGPGNPAQALSLTIGGTNKLINASPTSGHTTPGVADTLAYIVENLDSTHTAIDSTTGKVAVIEAVRVTATVDPTLSFTIAGITADSGSYCGVTRTGSSPDSTATTVPMGSLSITAFTDAAQQLTASTNAISGYVVTAIEDDQLSIDGASVTELGDFTGGSYSASTEWTSTSTKGFGFSLQNIDAQNANFTWNESSRTFSARHFPALADGGAETTPQSIFYSTGPREGDDVYICYRAIISAVQQAGNYENMVTYNATATF